MIYNTLNFTKFCVILFIAYRIHGCEGGGDDEEEFPPHDYDKSESADHGKFQYIDLSLWIESIIKVDTTAMELQLYTYLIQEWNDNRLNNTQDHVRILQDRSSIWTPDVYCLNCRQSNLETDKTKYLVRISMNGDLYYSQSGLLYVSCHFDFKDFPFDTQSCSIQISSYSYNDTYMSYRWKRDIDLKNLKLEQFQIHPEATLSTEVAQYVGGNFTVLIAQFKFTRETGFYVLRLFIPCAMLVGLSWIAFYIAPTEIGDRLAIGITLILSMIFLLGYVDASLPKVSYVKAIDWYMIVALLMIISSVIETVVVYLYAKRKENRKKEQQINEENEKESLLKKSPLEMNGNGTNNQEYNNCRERRNIGEIRRMKTEALLETAAVSQKAISVGGTASEVDLVTRVEYVVKVMFPLVYVVYNIIYIYIYGYRH